MSFAAARLFVSGRVQGVGFRAFVAGAAGGLGLSGWVRNRADGRVEILAEGDAVGLAELARACARGPLLARVDDVAVTPEPAGGQHRGFRQVGDA